MVEEAQEDRPTVLVGCKIPNGISLHVMKRKDHALSFADLGGVTPSLEDKGFVDLAGTSFGKPATEVFTPVDAEMWAIWAEENKHNPLVANGLIFTQDEEEGEADRPANEAEHEEPRGEPVVHGDSPAAAVDHERMSEEELERLTHPHGTN